jgi:hypothetical protein
MTTREERRRGRRPLDPEDRSVPVHLRLPSRAYDVLYHRARQAGTSVPDVIRRDLAARDRAGHTEFKNLK